MSDIAPVSTSGVSSASSRLSVVEMKLRSQIKQDEEKENSRIKRDVIVLIQDYLAQNGYVESLHKLQSESGVSLSRWQAADNIDLKVMLQEFENFWKLKFGKVPKLVRRATPEEVEERAGGGATRTTYQTPGLGGVPVKTSLPPSSSSQPDDARYGRRAQSGHAPTAAARRTSIPLSSPSHGSLQQSAAKDAKDARDAKDTRDSKFGNASLDLAVVGGSSGISNQVSAARLNSEHAMGLDDRGNPINARGSAGAVHARGASGGAGSLSIASAKTGSTGSNRYANGAPVDAEGEGESQHYFDHRVMKPMPNNYDGEMRELASVIHRDIFTANPNIFFHDIIGLSKAKQLLEESVVFPLRFPGLFRGLRAPWKGILLYGPPGVGKTLMAKAVATECRTTFFNISASSIVSKYRGDSEKLVRVLFEMARYYAPSTIFIDEIDSLVGTRDAAGEHEASRRMKTELLIQMDGLTQMANSSDGSGTNTSSEAPPVFVLAASNHPWHIDTALLRRLEKRVFVPLPDANAREALLRHNLVSGENAEPDLNYTTVAQQTESFSGSDIVSLCREAAMRPVRRLMAQVQQIDNSRRQRSMSNAHSSGSSNLVQRLAIQASDLGENEIKYPEVDKITHKDVEEALKCTRPSAGKKFLTKYEEWSKQFGSEYSHFSEAAGAEINE